jgi:hypothetical protein
MRGSVVSGTGDETWHKMRAVPPEFRLRPRRGSADFNHCLCSRPTCPPYYCGARLTHRSAAQPAPAATVRKVHGELPHTQTRRRTHA